MQSTVNLWEALCHDFELQKEGMSAEECLETAKNFADAARGLIRPTSPKLVDAIEIAGDVCQGCGYPNHAKNFFLQALELAQKIGVMASVSRIATKLAQIEDSAGELQTARSYYETALQASHQANDLNNQQIILLGLADVCKKLGDQQAVSQALAQIMDLAIHIHGENHPEVATAATNLGVACTETGELEQAESLHLRALSIREKCFGGLHPEVAQSLANLGVVYHSLGDFDRASRFYLSALEIYRRYKPSNDPVLAAIQANLDSLPNTRKE